MSEINGGWCRDEHSQKIDEAVLPVDNIKRDLFLNMMGKHTDKVKMIIRLAADRASIFKIKTHACPANQVIRTG